MADEPEVPRRPRREDDKDEPRRPARRRDEEADDEADDRPRRRPAARDDSGEDGDDRPRRRRRRRDEDDEGDDAPALIPYKNGKALAAYYCGVFALVPVLGCVLGPVALILGILGISYANQHPRAKGKGHAIAGIVLGVVVAPIVWGAIFFFFYWAVNRPAR
jgi:hypothetical protein